MRPVPANPAQVPPVPVRGAGRQRGFLLIAAVVLIVAAALVLTVLVFLSTTGNMSAAGHMSAKQALFIAESGIEKGIREWKLNPAYTGETNTPFANGSFTVTTSPNDYSGTTPLPSGRLRFLSVGTVAGGVATRTVNAIAGPENLLPTSANSDFNADPGECRYDLGCQPDGWDLQPAVPANKSPQYDYSPWDDCAELPEPGYPAINNVPCSTTGAWDRAAFARKGWNGAGSSTSAGNFTFSPPVSVTAPATLTLRFDYYLNRLGAGGAPNEMQMTFRLKTATETWTSSPDPFYAALEEQWAQGEVTFAITGTGTKLIQTLEFDFELKAGQPKQAWLDNLVLGSGAGPPNLEIKAWREDYQ
jgi:hypothetical protein